MPNIILIWRYNKFKTIGCSGATLKANLISHSSNSLTIFHDKPQNIWTKCIDSQIQQCKLHNTIQEKNNSNEKQENTSHNEEKNIPIKTNPEITHDKSNAEVH